jgi:filamentous hemagglutinin
MTSRSRVTRTLVGIVCLQIALGPQAVVLAADLGPAPVPSDSATNVGASANGTAVLNISAPNSAGVSHNRFSSYDVDARGLVINNSAANAVSLLGGGVPANANLTNGSASLILNEVIRANGGSQLNGYQEILGSSAELVIANPWGITCNGCGFVNTPRVTLTTGTPTLSAAGALQGFTINGGLIAVTGEGLDATRQRALDLMARSVTIGGNVLVGSAGTVSGDLGIFAGAGQFDYASRSGSALASGSAGNVSGPAPQFAIDSSALGGMYADRIRLLVTEQGAGVRVAGDLAALADDLTLEANGRIELRGAASAARDLSVHGAEISISLPGNDTYVYGGRDLSLLADGALTLGTGSVGASRNLSFNAASLTDAGGASAYRFTSDAGSLRADISGALDLSGGLWHAPTIALNAGSVRFGTGSVLYGYGASGSSLSVTTPGLLSIDGGEVYSAADAAFAANRLNVSADGVVAADGALTANVSRGSAGGVDNAGVIQGSTVALTATGADTTKTIFNNATTGQIVATDALVIRDAGDSTLTNRGVVSGGTVTIATRDTLNANGAIQAATHLDLQSETLQNLGANAQIIGSTTADGSATIAASTVTNSGTIWSDGDLSLKPVTLQQQREAGSASNPLIGAGRDLTVAYQGDADLGTGDLQAGRDLTITASSVNDSGSTGLAGATADVRYAARNLNVTAQPGGSIYLGGGGWFSQSDLRFTGDSVYVGARLNRQTNAIVGAAGVLPTGGWGGTGTLALTARAGGVSFISDGGLYSGNDLAISQATLFAMSQPTILQSKGLLSISAAGGVINYGTILGDTIELSSNNGTPLAFTNGDTGVLAGNTAVRIGTATNRAGTVRIFGGGPGSLAGVYGGGIQIYANSLYNNGLLQGAGPYTNLDVVGTFVNDVDGRIMGFTDTTGTGGLGIGATDLVNHGLIYDSSVLRIYANHITNGVTGAIAGPGLMQVYTLGTSGPSGVFDNLGEVWGGDVYLTLYNGLLNGRDHAVVANRQLPSSIYASNSLTITGVGPASIINYGAIESEGNISFQNAGSGNGLLQNVMSKVDDSELRWVTGGSPFTEEGHLGLLLTNPGSSHTGWTDITLDGKDYYRFTEAHGGSFAYIDRRATYIEPQALRVPLESLSQPTIRAGGNLSIDGFASVLNYSGSLGAVGDVSIKSVTPGSSVTNASWQLGSRHRVDEGVSSVRCMTFANDPVNCLVAHDHLNHGFVSSNTRYVDSGDWGDGVPGLIYAGGGLDIRVAGTVTNSGSQGAFVKNPHSGPTESLGVSVSGPGATGSRNGATSLNLNGAAIPLPASANGRFVGGKGSGTDPLFETNPLFGIDSINLGSDYLAKLLGLQPEQQARRLGDDNYEGYLIKEQVQAATGRGVLGAYWSTGDMVQALFDNAADEASSLKLGYGKALTPDQVASLKSDIVWMVEQEVKGQKVLIPVVYLCDATRATVAGGASMEGYNVNINAGTLKNEGGNIAATNALLVKTTGNIENISGRMAGWNVRLDAGGDLVNSTLVKRSGDAQNGTDTAQRTSVIEAGNTAVLKAARDVNVTGAWVAAGKDAVLIAGRNVNVESVALTANSGGEDGGDSWSRQTQTALGGGIVAGNDIATKAGQDVNLKGADVEGGGTTAIQAERNVNVGVLELTNKSTSTTTKTGRYDALDMNRDAGTIGLGLGIEKKTTTETTTTTVGVGSTVAGGKGVQISTGKGDVNVTGSAINAGEDGIVIDSARNVNVTAYNDKTETESSTNSIRAGIAIDLSTDGVFAGTGQSGNKTTETTTQTTARTSSLTSGGKVVIRGKGDVTNEGTQIDAAGDVALIGENVINKAARDTYTTSTTTDKWETKQQQGITTNGMGSSIADAAQGKGNQVTVANVESQVRLTGSGSTETNTTSSSQARGTNVKAGGNVVVVAKNNASDEGTQYKAGKDIVVSAENYENKAAADTTETSTERTYGSGKLTVGVNTSVEATMTASAEGGHEKSSETTSTAKTGSMKAGGNVVIEARSGNVTLEGTQVDGAKGVGITAAGDVNLTQANNTTTKTSSSESGSGRVSGSISLIGTGGSVGAGASTRLAKSEEATSTAVTGNIRSGEGNVQVGAGRDIKSQGTGIEAAGNVALKAGRDIDLAAATDTVTKTGSVDAGGVNVDVGFGTGAAKSSGGVSASVDFERGRTDYQETTEKGSNIKAGGTFSVDAGRDARLEGTQVDANAASLKTGGNLVLESAQHTVKDDSYNVSGRVEASASKGGGVGGASSVGQGSSGTTGNKGGGNAGGGNAQVDVKRSYQDIEKNTNATINTREGTTVDVGGDMKLAGANINAAGGVAGQVAGNLTIESRADKEIVDQKDVKTYAGVGPVGGVGGANKADRTQNAVQGGANNVAQTGVFADVNSQKKDNLTVGTQSGINGGAGGIDVKVGGNTTLKGAANTATDFKTQGQTTVESVDTHTSSSSVDFRAAGTVASAAGSDKGKGGDYGLNVALPSSGKTPKAGARPGVPNDSAPNTAPARPRSGSTGGDAPDVTRPRGNTTADAPSDYANTPSGARPRANSVGDNAPAPVRPTDAPPSDYANVQGGVRPRGPAPRSTESNYQTGVPGADAPRPVVNASNNANPQANPPVHLVSVDPVRPAAPRSEVVEHLLPKITALENGVRYGKDDVKAARRNLEEIEAYGQARDPVEAKRMLEQFEKALQPPRVREDGFKEFPLMPQFVGETVAGFDNWNTRRSDDAGTRYKSYGSPPDTKVTYFSEPEREAMRVFVASDGTIVDAKGQRLPDAEYIFVVDSQGRMIARAWDSRYDKGLVHHSSLSEGDPVLMAGEIHMKNGEITMLANRSGHFRPDTPAYKRFVDEFQAMKPKFASNGEVVTVEMYTMPRGGTGLRELSRKPAGEIPSAEVNGAKMLGGMKTSQPPKDAPAPAVHVPINEPVRNVAPPIVLPRSSVPRENSQEADDEDSPYNTDPVAAPAGGGANQPPTGWVLPEFFKMAA